MTPTLILRELHKLAKNEARAIVKTGGTTQGGHSFEDLASRTIFNCCKQLGLKSNPARHTLSMPTFSGMKHQFDCSFSQGNVIFVVECKSRKMSTKEQIYYFNSTIMDYILGFKLYDTKNSIKGIFASAADVDDNSLAYSFAYGITVVVPKYPPIEYAIELAPNEQIKEALIRLTEKIPDYNPLLKEPFRAPKSSEEITREYKFLLTHIMGATD